MPTDTIKIRTDVPVSVHPDILTPFEKALNIPQTVGLAAYAAGREAMTAMYSTYSEVLDALRAVQDAAAPGRRRQHPDGRSAYTDNLRFFGSELRVMHGREAEMAAAAERAIGRTIEAVDRRTKEIDGHAFALSERVRVALEDPARKTPEGLSLASEARAHVKALRKNERLFFVLGLVKEGDRRTVSAVLTAQAFLSGLSEDDHAALRKSAEEAFAPQDWRQLLAVQAVSERVLKARGHLTRKCDDILRLRDTPSARAATKLKNLEEGAR